MKDMPPAWLAGAKASPAWPTIYAGVVSLRADGQSLRWATARSSPARCATRSARPVLATYGTSTFPAMVESAERVRSVLPQTDVREVSGAHHVWDRAAFASVLTGFVRSCAPDAKPTDAASPGVLRPAVAEAAHRLGAAAVGLVRLGGAPSAAPARSRAATGRSRSGATRVVRRVTVDPRELAALPRPSPRCRPARCPSSRRPGRCRGSVPARGCASCSCSTRAATDRTVAWVSVEGVGVAPGRPDARRPARVRAQHRRRHRAPARDPAVEAVGALLVPRPLGGLAGRRPGPATRSRARRAR